MKGLLVFLVEAWALAAVAGLLAFTLIYQL